MLKSAGGTIPTLACACFEFFCFISLALFLKQSGKLKTRTGQTLTLCSGLRALRNRFIHQARTCKQLNGHCQSLCAQSVIGKSTAARRFTGIAACSLSVVPLNSRGYSIGRRRWVGHRTCIRSNRGLRSWTRILSRDHLGSNSRSVSPCHGLTSCNQKESDQRSVFK